MDFDRPNPADHPGFFLHLGDVVYNTQYYTPESKKRMYQPQFYEPYGKYPGKILAIPGNHDSNPQEDPMSINAFQDNFCVAPPENEQELQALLTAINRPPMYQPGVYYRLDTPFVQILALFSNGGEKEGVIKGHATWNHQWDFLVDQLKEIKATRDANPGGRRALLLAVHHPPFSGGGGHTGSSQMRQELDEAFTKARLQPDAILSGHAHLYERFTREISINRKLMRVPYIVAGCGGHGITPLKPKENRKPVQHPLKSKSGDHILRQYFNGFGHLNITVTPHELRIDLIGTKTETQEPVDSVTVKLAANFEDNIISHETPFFVHPALGEQETAHTRKS
jgi:hypothetical protein